MLKFNNKKKIRALILVKNLLKNVHELNSVIKELENKWTCLYKNNNTILFVIFYKKKE